jgi:hypothetical protein
LSFRFHQPLRCVEPARAVTRRTDELGVYRSACVGNRLYANSTSLMIIVTCQPQHARATRGRIIKMEFSNLNAASHIVGTKNEHVYRPRSHRRFGCSTTPAARVASERKPEFTFWTGLGPVVYFKVPRVLPEAPFERSAAMSFIASANGFFGRTRTMTR